MIKGAIASLVTPFRDDETLNYEALSRLSNRMATAGFDVICFAGGTGEFLSLTEEERSDGLKAVIDGAEGKPVLATALFTNPNDILAASERSAALGASAIMVMPPYFYAASQDAIYEHLKIVGSKSVLPVLLFNSSGRAGCTISPETILRLAQSSSNIVGVKETTENMNDIGKLAADAPEQFQVIQAHEPVVLPSCAMGASGSFGSLCNIIPDAVVALHKAIDGGDFVRARLLTRRISEVAEVAYSVTIPVGIKYLMSRAGLSENIVRPPLTELTDEKKRSELEKILPKILKLQGKELDLT